MKCLHIFGSVLLLSAMSLAWNCPAGQIRQQAPAGTPTNTPYYDVVEGIAFICVPNTPPPSTPTPSTQNQTQSQNQNQNQSATATSGSTSNSTSGATSGSTSSATGGTSNATGGKSTSTSGVSNSGNSSNTNTNVAQGGKGGSATAGVTSSGNSSQTQSTNSSANGNGDGNGNNSNNYASTTNIAASKIPVSTAFAPTVVPTSPCFKGFGAAFQSMPVGASFGGGKIDANCRALQTTLHAPNRLTYCKLFINLQDSKAAHLTLEECMQQDSVITVTTTPAVPVEAPAPQIIVVPVQTPAPIVAVPVATPKLAGTCLVLDNICKAELDDAINWHKQSDGTLVIYGSLTTYRVANAMRLYLTKNGVPSSGIRIEMAAGGGTEVGIAYLQ